MKASFMNDDVLELTLRVCEGLGSPRSVAVAILARHGEWDQLVSLTVDAKDYLDAAAYANANCATMLLRKFDGLPTTFDKEALAFKSWCDGERDCYHTNERLGPYLPENRMVFDDVDPRIDDFLSSVRQTILHWIGPKPSGLTVGRFGPGGTYSDKGKKTTIPHKMSAPTSMTREAIWYLPQWLGTAWGAYCASFSLKPTVVPGNRWMTVPKDARKVRAIAVEPSINVFFQLGLGAELRQHLRKIGVDLQYGQALHRRLACEASLHGELATLDLSNASDTVSRALVKLLLPPAWFEALESLRSPKTRFTNWRVLEKFSSMGNGYTFELETLLFLALSVCATDRALSGDPVRIGSSYAARRWGTQVSVYGDDIIVPTNAVRNVTAVLNFCGFTINREKSFSDGPFRESCGGDFHTGAPVRAYYLKGAPCEVQDWISTANGIREMDQRLRASGSPANLRRAWFYCLDQIPTSIRRCRGPKALGDLVIHDDERFWNTRRRSQIRYIRVYRPTKATKVPYGRFHPDVVMACATYGLGWGGGGVTPRNPSLSYKVGWKAYS